MSYLRKIRDTDSYMQRLERFLSDACMRFNPYTVSNRRLWDGLQKMRWRGEFSLTQMVILRFERILTEGSDIWQHERIVCRIGDSPDEIIKEMSDFTAKHTAADSLQPVRSTINGHPVIHAEQIRPLIGKTVFISRNITTVTHNGGYSTAMSMHRLKGNLATDAAVIRQAIIASKLEMLDRLLDHPESHIYLDGETLEPMEIATPINRLKEIITSYPSVTPPED